MRTIPGVVAAAILAGCASRPEAPPPPARDVLSVDEVVRLHEAGVASKVVVAKIQTSEIAADMPVARIIELKQKGLPDDVLEALVRAAEPDPPPRRVVLRPYGPSYWDPWYYRHPYVY